MNYWKFNLEVQGDQPSAIPDLAHIKKWYYSGTLGFNGMDVARTGIYRRGGWAFDFRDEMKKYIVRYTDGHLEEMWAPDRTSLRDALGSSKIYYIVDVPEKYY